MSKSSEPEPVHNKPTPKPKEVPVPLVGGVAVTIGRIVRVVENANHVGPVKIVVRAGIIAAIPEPTNPEKVEVSVFRTGEVASIIAQYLEPETEKGGDVTFALVDDRAPSWHWPPKG
jgi:hypothetical protein